MAKPDAKLQTLQQHGTLNPRPKDVRDQLFLQEGFFDPRDLGAAQKLLHIRGKIV